MEDFVELADAEDIDPRLSPDTRDRILSYLDNNKENSKPVTNKVSKAMCEDMKHRYENGATANDILQDFPIETTDTVYFHVNDKCTHTQRSKVTYDECGWMRVKSKKGAPTKTLAVLYNVSQDTAYEHISDRCNHELHIDPVEPSKLRDNMHPNTETVTSTCAVCSKEFEHKNYVKGTTCSNRCSALYASQKAQESFASND